MHSVRGLLLPTHPSALTDDMHNTRGQIHVGETDLTKLALRKFKAHKGISIPHDPTASYDDLAISNMGSGFMDETWPFTRWWACSPAPTADPDTGDIHSQHAHSAQR